MYVSDTMWLEMMYVSLCDPAVRIRNDDASIQHVHISELYRLFVCWLIPLVIAKCY